jgi:FixJ family two-component response regulator
MEEREFSMSARPIIMFVDDEPHNLVVFEAAMPAQWEIKIFDNPLSAVEKVETLKPAVIVSDQRMPGMMGVKFLELAGKLSPHSVRILVTGYSDEDLIIESVRAAKIFDYIRKPWEVDELIKRIEAAVQYNEMTIQRELLASQLLARERELSERNAELTQNTLELERSNLQLQEMSRELSCWVPPVVTWLSKHKVTYPVRKDLAVLAIDIIGSGAIHGLSVGETSLRALALQEFAILVIKHGGYIEQTEGDAAYANFGLSDWQTKPCDAALAVAFEFRAALLGIASHHQKNLECGIGMHYAPQTEANISEYHVNTPKGVIIQKRFYTSSPDVDLVHRMEKHVHKLPGSNIVFSRQFLEQLTHPPSASVAVGSHLFKGQNQPVELLLIKSDKATDDDIQKIIIPQAG